MADGDLASDAANRRIRKRMRRREYPGAPRFITFSCYRRMPLFGNPAIANEFLNQLRETRTDHPFRLFAYVVMPEHVHLLMAPDPEPGAPSAGATLGTLKRSFAQRIIARWRKLNAPVLRRLASENGTTRFWQRGGGFDRNVRDVSEFCDEVRYIHRNPVERGLVQRPEDWRWSSVRWWMGVRDGELLCDAPPEPSFDWKNWRGYA